MIIFMTIFICKLTGTATNVKDMCSLLFKLLIKRVTKYSLC